jgi:hypothetical protein
VSVGSVRGDRRAWLLAVVVLEIVGLGLLLLSFALAEDQWPGVLVEFGSSLIMFAPLVLLGRDLERRLDHVQQAQRGFTVQHEEAASRIADLAKEMAQTQVEVRRTHDELSRAVLSRLVANRMEDEALFGSVEFAPSHRVLADALTRASRLGLITSNGCRVELSNTQLYLWFQVVRRRRPGGGPRLALQRVDGSTVTVIRWPKSRSAEDILLTVGEAVQASGTYPGDGAFEPGRVFADLRTLFRTAHQLSTTMPTGPLVQLCPPQWAVTSHAITCVQPEHTYTIALGDLRDAHSYAEVISAAWLDRDSFDKARCTATALYEARNRNGTGSTRFKRGNQPPKNFRNRPLNSLVG